MHREDHPSSDLPLTRNRSTRHGVPVLALLVVLLVVGATVLAITSRPPGPGSPTSPLPVDPFSAHSAPSSTLGAIRPAGDSATVLATISTLNGTTRPGNQPYPGGQYPFNVTVAGNNRIAVVAEYSGNPLLVNATSGVLVAAPAMPGIPTGSAYDPLNGALYVADLSNRSVEEFDPNDGGVLGTIAVPGYPQAIAFDAVHDQLIVVTGLGTTFGYGFDGPSAVLFIDPATGAILADEPTGANPVGLAIDPLANQVYVVDEGSGGGPGSYGNVSTYSTATHALIAQLPAAGGPVAAEFDPARNEVFTANNLNNTVSVFNGSSHALVTTVALGGTPSIVTFDPRADEIVVVCYDDSFVVMINATTNAIRSTVGFPTVDPNGIAYSASTNRFFASSEYGNYLTGLNATTLTVETYTPFGLDPVAAALDTASGTLYVLNSETSNITYINVVSDRVLGNISAGPDPSSLVYDNASGLIYVSDLAGSLTVIDPANDSVIGSIPVGVTPNQVVYDSANERLYVVNEGSENVTVVSGTTGAVLASVALAPDETPYTETMDTGTGELYVDEITGPTNTSLVPIDPTTDTPGTSIAYKGIIDQVDYDPGNGDLVLGFYAAGANSSSVLLVDPATGAIVETVPLAGFIGTVGWLPELGVLAWGNYATNSLTMFGGSPGLVLASTAVGVYPAATVADPETGRIYVVNEYSSSVSVVGFSEQPNSVAVATNPASCGRVDLGGTVSNGSLSLDSGVYSAVAPACYNYDFHGWSMSGGISVAGSTNASTEITVIGNGTLTAVYGLSPDARYTVTVSVMPTSCGSVVTLAGQEYSSGAPVDLAPASYSLGAGPCGGYTFSAWQLTGLVSIVIQGPLGGVLTVSGNGTLTAVYVPAAGGTASGSSGYSATDLVAFLAVGVLAGALAGVLVGRRRPTAGPAPPSEPPKSAT